tara:strand:- start:47 stop:469 length:423 start_codon:yes stop_codon:yes gene_type:complete
MTDVLDFEGNKTNILDQLASYNYEDLESYLYNLKREFEEQTNLNTLLKAENTAENIKTINDFVERQTPAINNQLLEIKELTEKLKNVVNENTTLEHEIEEYNILLKSEKCNEVAFKLKEIKQLKQTINIFLEKRGIITPQ